MRNQKLALLRNKDEINRYLQEHSISMECFLLGCYSVLLYKTGYLDSGLIRVNGCCKQSVICVPVNGTTNFGDLLQGIEKKLAEDIHRVNVSDACEFPSFYYCDAPADIGDVEKCKGKNCRNQSLSCFHYDNELSLYFDAKDEIRKLMEGRMQKIIDEFIRDSQITIENICVINDTEDQMIKKFIAGQKREIPDICFHQMFEKMAREYPDRTAVIYADKKITYRQLNEKANQLAHYIHRNYLVTERLIGIFMERSIEYIIAILGIMKSGNGYVPIDSDTLNPGHENFPIKRLQFMILETNMPLIIAKSQYRFDISREESDILCLDDCNLSYYDNENLNLNISKNNMAYGIYTSGSTGYPKLTIVEHASVMNLFASIDAYMYSNIPGKDDVFVSVNAPFGFDASVQQLVALLKGYSICIIPENVRNSAVGLIQYIADSKMNVFDCTPSQLNLLLRENLLQKCKNDLNVILVGGEAISKDMWRILQEEKKIMIFNVYGPTECTVDSTFCLINNPMKTDPHIGRPIDNCCVYILDSNLKNVPVGSFGELYISGFGVARGYHNREELNRIHFIPDPEVCPKTDKIYKTGDIGKFLSNGDIYYLGRKDDQIKIRSHRIELNEIMTILNKHEDVADSLVIVNSDSGYEKLIAYLIMKDEALLDDVEMNGFLSKYLPMYMLPNNYVKISKWPLTKNGKIDKSKLPLPLINRSQSDELYEAPSTELEKSIADIMMRILKINRIGVNENFMSLGGDSLRVMTLLAEIYNIYNIEIDFSEFFNKPNIANLASLISRDGR